MKITWFGHAAFMVEVDGFSCLLDPWLENPTLVHSHARPELPSSIDAIFVSHGHSDHVGNASDLAKKHHATIYCIHELTFHFRQKGVPNDQLVGMNIGGSIDLTKQGQHRVRASMVNAVHSSSTCGVENDVFCGGSAAGWILELPNGHTIYHSGDTGLFGDMKIITDFYKPTVGLICIGDHYTMGPTAASFALDHLLTSIQWMIPMHYGTFPLLTGRPDQMKVTRSNLKICPLEPGKSLDIHGVHAA
jgi:L-ascorbate metabolism protein UlaG (beta-lactamase superfamily)